MVAIIITTTITALIGAMVSFMFSQINKRLTRMEEEDKKHREDQVQTRIAERELMLAEARISALSARCIRGEHVNGDLEEAENYLTACKRRVETLAHRTAIEKLED